MKAPTSLLTLNQVEYSLPVMSRAILKDLSLTFHAGEFVMILGSNGSGKSSLLKCLNGSVRPTGGEITLEGTSYKEQSTSLISKKVATLGQSIDSSTFGSLTVEENCRLATRATDARIRVVLAECNPELLDRLHTPAARLSGGQRQCLALALCILRGPLLLLLDEHTSALDPKAAQSVMRVTNELHTKDPRRTIVMSTHSLEDAMTYGTRLLIMQQGRCVLDVSGHNKRALQKEEILKHFI